MQTDKRQHRTPFVARGIFIDDAAGNHVAVCATPGLARFICVACNFFDRLTRALKLCRGEFDGLPAPTNRPAYVELMQLHKEIEPYEKELRG